MTRSKKKTTSNGSSRSDAATDSTDHYQAYYSSEHERDFFVDSSSSDKNQSTWYAPSVAITEDEDAANQELTTDDIVEEEDGTRTGRLLGSVWTWAVLYVVGLALLTWVRLSIPMDSEFTTSSTMELVLKPFQPKTLDPALAEQMNGLADANQKNQKHGARASDFLFTPWVLLLDDTNDEPEASSEL
mmetsp:Transcript_21790/g.60571  ORF Transcript_21790/g.60571 Transcript_21790/m.60571 type:complete len:187 (+) Transcript_21790:300-860(+)